MSRSVAAAAAAKAAAAAASTPAGVVATGTEQQERLRRVIVKSKLKPKNETHFRVRSKSSAACLLQRLADRMQGMDGFRDSVVPSAMAPHRDLGDRWHPGGTHSALALRGSDAPSAGATVESCCPEEAEAKATRGTVRDAQVKYGPGNQCKRRRLRLSGSTDEPLQGTGGAMQGPRPKCSEIGCTKFGCKGCPVMQTVPTIQDG